MLKKIFATKLILCLWTTSLSASDVRFQGDVILHVGDRAEFFGVLVSEQRYRDFRIYEKESRTMNDLLLEQSFEMRKMQQELDFKDYGTIRLRWFVIGFSTPFVICLLLKDRCNAFGSK